MIHHRSLEQRLITSIYGRRTYLKGLSSEINFKMHLVIDLTWSLATHILLECTVLLFLGAQFGV